MKKNFLKIVVGSLTTISLILSLCFINVKASPINDNWGPITSNIYQFKDYEDINELNDLKGTIWKMNMNAINIWEEYGTYDMSLLLTSNETNIGKDIKDVPIILQSRSSLPGSEIQYSFRPNAKLNIVPLVSNQNSLTFDFNQGGFYGSINGYRYEVLEDEAYIRVIGPNYFSHWFEYITSEIPYFPVYLDISNPYNAYNNPLQLATCNASDIYILFNYGNWAYDLHCYSRFLSVEENYTQEELDNALLDFIKYNFTQISFEGLAWYTGNQEYSIGYDEGYDDGFENGVQYANENNGGYRFPILSGVFNAVDDLLSIELFPNVRLSYFIFLPLVLGIVGVIFYFWRKD